MCFSKDVLPLFSCWKTDQGGYFENFFRPCVEFEEVAHTDVCYSLDLYSKSNARHLVVFLA